MKEESMFDLIKQASAMLQDRNEDEAYLIYYVCTLPEDLRTAIVFAYKNLEEVKNNER